MALTDSNSLEEEEEIQPEATNGAGTVAPEAEPVEYVETEDADELRSLIFQTSDVVEELLAIPEWKVTGPDGKTRLVQILLRSLSANERLEFLNVMNKSGNDLKKMYPDLAILGARHPKTKKLLWKVADRGELLRKNGAALERIAMRMAEISALTPEFLDSMKKK